MGNTGPLSAPCRKTTVHPHVRGEYRAGTARTKTASGSSPRAWGIPGRYSQDKNGVRFIPTCVGNTSPPRAMSFATTVHPHVRGEYWRSETMTWTRRGSSPRAWGIQNASCVSWGCQRFIPTCVGNTPSGRQGWQPCSVHPHVRGEYITAALIIAILVGSSPRAWGIQCDSEEHDQQARFIPTCVGNTLFRSRQAVSSPVHPHVRGEYFMALVSRGMEHGSSPRAWGIQRCPVAIKSNFRFIPTCVGNTA